MGTVLDVIFFKTLPLFFSWWKGEEETDSYRAGLWNVSGNHLLPCTSQRLIFCGGDNHNGELQSSRHPLQRPNPAGLGRRRSLGCRAPPPGSRPVCVRPRTPPAATASAKAEARARHPRPGWDPGLLWRSPFRGGASEQRREDTGSWAAGSSPPRWESQPRPILLPARPGGPL